MKPAQFRYLAPTSVEEAVSLLAELGEETKVLAGGQSLVPILALRLSRFEALVDLGHVRELQRIEHLNGSLTVGAMTRQADIEHSDVVSSAAPLLAKATPLIGHFQIRNRGTLGGSIAHADPSAEYPAVAVALDAELDIVGPDGSRSLRAEDFFQSTFVTDLRPAEVLTAVRFPHWGPGAGFAVEEVARRRGDFALAGVACGVVVAAGKVERVAIVFFGMGSTPVRPDSVEAAMLGTQLDDLDPAELGRAAVRDLEPPDDVHASSGYRRQIGAVLVARAVTRAIEEATRG